MDLILVVEGIKRSNLLNPKRASWNDWNGGLWGSNVFLFWGIIANWSDLAPGDDELLVQQGATAELHFDFDGLLFTVKRKRENSARRSCGNQEWRGELLLSRQGVWPCVKHVFFLWCENETRLFQYMGVGTRFLAQENENIGVQRDSVMEIPCWWKYYIALYCRCITHVRNVYRWTSSCTKIGW